MTTYYPTYAGPRTLGQIKARNDWKMLDPEFARRAEAIMVAFDGRLGYGQGGRTAAQQKQLFLERYYVDPNGSIFYDGKRWSKYPGVASAAVPGTSYHEQTPPGGALAIDFMGEVTLLKSHGADYGLCEFSDVNREPWHGQPIEIPHSRRDYRPEVHYPLDPWPLPGSGQPTPPPQEDEMLRQFRVANDAATFLVDGLTVTWIHDEYQGQNVQAALEKAKVCGPAELVERAVYAALELRGPKPDYTGVDMNIFPDQTYETDFAKHTP